MGRRLDALWQEYILATPTARKMIEDTLRSKCAIGLTTVERRFLEDVHSHHSSSITERYKRLSLNAYQGNRVQNSLMVRGLIGSESVYTSSGRVKILSLTKKGRSALGRVSPQAKRRGSGEHEYWKGKLANHLRSEGYEVAEELPIGGGKTVDLVASKGGQRIAIEIETGKSDPVENVAKNLEHGFGHVVCCVVKDELAARIADAIEAAGLYRKNVIVLTASDTIGASIAELVKKAKAFPETQLRGERHVSP